MLFIEKARGRRECCRLACILRLLGGRGGSARSIIFSPTFGSSRACGSRDGRTSHGSGQSVSRRPARGIGRARLSRSPLFDRSVLVGKADDQVAEEPIG